MNEVPKRRWGFIPDLIPGRDVEGGVSLTQFQLNFTLLGHAGWSGLLFVGIWVWSYWSLWTTYNYYIFTVIEILFGFLAWVSPQVSSNIYSRKLTFTYPGRDFDWVHYARVRMVQLLALFCINCSLLVWATGGLNSPFVPFYIMVFLLALSYCRFPQPATRLTLTFVAFFLISILLSEIPWIHKFVPPPIDEDTQAAIDKLYRRKLFEAGFIIASMLVPLISMYLAAWRTSDGLPAAAEAVASPTPGGAAPAIGADRAAGEPAATPVANQTTSAAQNDVGKDSQDRP